MRHPELVSGSTTWIPAPAFASPLRFELRQGKAAAGMTTKKIANRINPITLKKIKAGFKKIIQKKNIWIVFSVFAVASIAFLFVAPHAKAIDVATVLSPQKAMYSSIAWVVDLIFKLLTQIIALAGAVVDFALGLDAFASAEGVKIGWRILRDFSNMAFVVILLVMAFATIFGQETWGMKKLLPKLIAAALLINFSLAIAGFIIDISQYFSAFFLKAGVSGGGVSATLAHGLSISRLVQAAPDTSWSETLNSGLSALIYGSVLGGAVLLVAAFVFGALAFMLFARMFVLWTLLIVSPVVWVLWILPVTKTYFKQWWTAFLHWTFFAPIYCFFLYIALRIIDSDIIKNTFQANVRQMQSSTSAMDFASEFFYDATNIISYIIVIGLLIVGLFIAQKFSIVGAKGSMGFLTKQRDRIGGWAKKTGTYYGKRAGGAVGERALGAAAAIPGVGSALGLKYAHTRVKAQREDEKRKHQTEIIAKKSKGFGGIDNLDKKATIEAYVNAPLGSTRNALLQRIIKEGWTNDIPEERRAGLKRDLAIMEKYGTTAKDRKKAIMENAPEMYYEDTQLPSATMAYGSPGATAERDKISAEGLRAKDKVTEYEARQQATFNADNLINKEADERKAWTPENLAKLFEESFAKLQKAQADNKPDDEKSAQKTMAGVLKALNTKGQETKQLKDTQIKAGVDAIEKIGGSSEQILKSNLNILAESTTLQAKYLKGAVDTMEKFVNSLKPSEIIKNTAESWKSPLLETAWNNALGSKGNIRAEHIKALAKTDDEDLFNAVTDKLKSLKASGGLHATIEKYLSSPAGQSDWGI